VKKRLVGLGLVGFLLLAINGLSQAPGELPPPDSAVGLPPLDLWGMDPDNLMTRANTLLQQGNTNEAINVLMMCRQIHLQQNADRFITLMNLMLANGNLPQAERMYQENLAQPDRLAQAYFNLLHQYYINQGDKQALLDWTASLQTRTLPPKLRIQAFGWLLDTSRSMGPVSRVTDLVPVCITSFDVPTSRSLLTGVITAYNAAGDRASATKVLNAIERAARHQPDLRRMVTCQRINLLFSAGQWSRAESRFKKAAKALPDGELAACFQHARACAGKAKQYDMLNRLCVWILKAQKNKPATWQAAAGAWMETAKAQKAIADIPVRLETLMQKGCSTNMLVLFYYDYWILVVKDGKPADIVALLKFGDQLAETITDKKIKDQLRLMAVECNFMLEDYAQALQLFAEPLSSMSPDEQRHAVNKIKAHLALQKGDKQEAIDRFREFMNSVKSWTEPNVDPLTGLLYTKDMSLGFNAKRIGDILSSMNDAKGAQLAYQEANDYYAAAQKGVREKSRESEHIKARRAELAKLLKQ